MSSQTKSGHMKLGVFDSGLGGLLIARSIRDIMPEIDMLYLGDTLHLPYGNRSDEAIFNYTRRSMDFMFEQGCQLIIMACNTASAAALRRLQQTYLSEAWPGRNIIGVVVPTLETAIEHGYKNLGLIGTNYIIQSNIYHEELSKLSPGITLTQKATPLLVPLIEHGGAPWTQSVLEHYLQDFKEARIECLILGCTHYPVLKDKIREILRPDFPLISQDEILPPKLYAYLEAHPEHHEKMGRHGHSTFFVSDLTENYKQAAFKIYRDEIEIMQGGFHK